MHEHGQGHDSEGTGHGRLHLLIMMLCCLIPIVVIAVLLFANVGGTYLPFVFVFLCPLMMLLMMLPRMWARKKPEEN